MKYLLLIALTISTAKALTVEERLNAIPDIRYAMHLCNFNAPNHLKFKKRLILNNDTARVDCLESKWAEIQAKLNLRAQQESQLIADCIDLKNDTLLPAYARRILSRICR